MIDIDDLIEPRAKQILLAGLPPLLRPHAPTPSPDHSEKTESRPPIRGNPKFDFARKRYAAGRKLADTTTLPATINNTVQRHTSSSRTIIYCECGAGTREI